ncbi:hypothetical protein GS501_05380 [Saccharibacter sp. 17.LH.SD]|uniref:lipid-binding SYLF domain-containing protein n=1 Tax=Saccharibacter sp. 17.LH.SD TaxID=2689393 RepID=UPI00136B30BF|nr:lipid-binding SYLF domain-containing protein [Saccharibacter sp. 17.LH.SD]MXV44479.1 hypothetical protein [Saccharibacter sp. 17.LH.SD]
MSRLARSLGLIATSSLALLGACSSSSRTDNTARDQQNLVEQATTIVSTTFNDPQHKRPQELLKKSRAVMICPSISNVSLVFGGSGGHCVLLSRDARNSWSDPAFYHIGSGSFGLQLGYQNTQLVLFITSKNGLQALLDHQFTFDANASASFTTLSGSAQDSNVSGAGSDIYVMEKSNGVFVGASIGGSKLTSDSTADRNYYHQQVGPEDIVINMRVNNSAADPLRRALMKAGGEQTTTMKQHDISEAPL